METTNTPVTHAANGSPCRGAGQGSRGWLGGRRGLVVATVAVTSAAALALDQHWLAVADLVPLLFVMPCAAMMFMCMKGNHGSRTNAAPAPVPGEAPGIADTRN